MHRFTPQAPSKADIKLIRSLGQKKFREQEGLFVVEGAKMVAEALTQNRFKVLATYYTEDIGEDTMSRMTLLSSPSPALAVLAKTGSGTADNPSASGQSPLSEKSPSDADYRRLYLALDSVRDPGNMGTILRIADWFGVQRIYVSEGCVDIFNPKTIQASMGAILRKDVIVTDLQTLIPRLESEGVSVYATTLEGGMSIHKAPIVRDNALIIMGSENNGISPEVLSIVQQRLFIPPYPADALGTTSESLNVAIATAIACYEFRR